MVKSTGELTFPYQFKKIQSQKPNDEALVAYNEDKKRQVLTYSEFYTLSCRYAHILKENGVKLGDHVTTTVPICLESAVAVFGINLAGAIPSPLDITFRSGIGMTLALDRLKTNLIVVRDTPDDDVMQFFKSGITVENSASDFASLTWEKLPLLNRVYFIRRGGPDDFLSKLRAYKGGEYVNPDIKPDSSCFVHFTTGTPESYLKLTEISHEKAILHQDLMHNVILKKPYSKSIYINDWYWKSSLPYDIFHGMTRCMPDCFVEPKNFPKLLYHIVRAERLLYLDIQPVYLDEMIKMWEVDPENTNNAPLGETLNLLGMPITRKLIQRFKGHFQRFNLLYGNHECGACHGHTIDLADVDSFTDFDCGPMLPGCYSKLVDENWQPVPHGEKGRVMMKTPGKFKCFPGEPERTAACFDKDGWFISNDRAYYDKKGHLMPGGRIDSLILHGEYMIFPVWLEEMLSPLPGIQQIVAVPVLDLILFHAITVCVIRQPGVKLAKSEITKQLNKFVGDFKTPFFDCKYLIYFDDFPKKSDGNVDRSKMHDIVNDLIHNKKHDPTRIITE